VTSARRWRPGWVLGGYVALDALCVGAGMGVPIFCIALGLPVGYYAARAAATGMAGTKAALSKVLRVGAATSAVTFLMMAVIWGPCGAMLFGPASDLARFGIPLILYEPTASFIGWLVLMIFISPFLQLLTTVFAAQLMLLWVLPPADEERP